MSASEQKLIEALHRTSSAKVALAQIADYLEESYILNLPPSRSLLAALDSFSKNASTPTPLKAKAKKLIKQYRV